MHNIPKIYFASLMINSSLMAHLNSKDAVYIYIWLQLKVGNRRYSSISTPIEMSLASRSKIGVAGIFW